MNTGWPSLLVLVRHGKSLIQHYKDGRLFTRESKRRGLHGFTDRTIPLSPAGKLQAARLGITIRSYYGIFDCVYQSEYLRSQQTLSHLLNVYPSEERDGMQVATTGLINERDWGIFPMLTEAEAERLYPEFSTDLAIFGEVRVAPRGGENLVNVRERCASWICELRKQCPGKKILAVDHWGSRIALLAELEQWNERKMLDCMSNNNPDNCSVTEFRYDPVVRKLRLVRCNVSLCM